MSYFSRTIENIKENTIYTWELFIITTKDLLNTFSIYKSKNIYVFQAFDEVYLLNNIKYVIPLLKGDYIAVLNDEDINSPTRFSKQIDYLSTHEDPIISCLHMPITSDTTQLQKANMANTFIKKEEVDNGISGGFLSLDLYTFLIKKSFLKTLNQFLYYYSFQSEIDLILYFLRYTQISKIDSILYYSQIQRIPYSESLYYDYNLISQNKLVQFNINNILNLRSYFNEIIKKNALAPYCESKTTDSILIILDTIKIGGTETHVLSLAKNLNKQGIHSCIITNYCLAIEEYILNNIEVVVVDFNNLINLKSTIISLCKTHNFKEVQLHMCNDLFLCPLLKEVTNLNITLTVHGTYYNKNSIHESLKYIDKIIFVSKLSNDFYLDTLTSKTPTLLIPNKINKEIKKTNKNFLHHLLNLPTCSKILLYCSRLSHSKAYGGVQFLESFQKLAAKFPNTYAVILGDGESKILIDSKITKINDTFNNNRAFSLGSVSNVSDFYSSSYIVLGTGRVALEALNCGKPVLALGLKGYISVVDKNNISHLTDSNFGDHSTGAPLNYSNIYSNDLTNTLNFLLENPKHTRFLGNWSKHYCHKFLCY